MDPNCYQIWYDLKFQKFIGSIPCSSVFFNINSMINERLKKMEGMENEKVGICTTYEQMAKHLCMSYNTMRECMSKLKCQNLIEMDYVILEMTKAPFLSIGENGKTFSKPERLRFLYFHIVKQTESFNDAAVHGHISYWNDRTNKPLIQSMRYIAEATGLTYRQVQFSIKKLSNLNLIIANTYPDGRYELIALGSGTGKNVGAGESVEGTGKFCSYLRENLFGGAGDSVDNSVHRVQQVQKQEVGETPPPVFAHESSEKKEPIIERTYRNGLFEVRESVYHEWKKIYKQEDMDYVFNRFNRERKEGRTLKNTHELEFYRLMDFRLTDKSDRMEKDGRKEQEQEEQQRIERDKEQASIDAAIAESNARMRQRLDSLDPKPEETKPPIETPKPCEVVTMKSIEASEEKAKVKAKIKWDTEQERHKVLMDLWNMLSDEEKLKRPKPVLISAQEGT